MKKLFVLAVALSLTGCATFEGIKQATTIVTASVNNPITPERLDTLESTLVVVFSTLRAWKSSCQQKLIPQTCRGQIAKVQVYTRQLPPYLERLRAFVRDNDQVNALTVFNQISDIVTTVRAQSKGNVQ